MTEYQKAILEIVKRLAPEMYRYHGSVITVRCVQIATHLVNEIQAVKEPEPPKEERHNGILYDPMYA